MTALRHAASGAAEAEGPDLAGAVARLFGLEVDAEPATAELVESPGVASLEPVP
jgi:hypothetical protein